MRRQDVQKEEGAMVIWRGWPAWLVRRAAGRAAGGHGGERSRGVTTSGEGPHQQPVPGLGQRSVRQQMAGSTFCGRQLGSPDA
jgi:hypothetical protein